jgi:hypothetical protein
VITTASEVDSTAGGRRPAIDIPVIAAQPVIALCALMLKAIGIQHIRHTAGGIPCGMFIHLPATKFSLNKHHLCKSDTLN